MTKDTGIRFRSLSELKDQRAKAAVLVGSIDAFMLEHYGEVVPVHDGEMIDLAKRASAKGQSRSSFEQLAAWAHDVAEGRELA